MISSILTYFKYGFQRLRSKFWLSFLRRIGPEKGAIIYGYIFRSKFKKIDPTKRTVFTYNRAQFARDIAELKTRTNFNYIVLEIDELFYITDAYIPHTYGGQVNFNGDQSPECLEYKRIITQVFEKIFSIISKKYKIDFILCANYDCSYDYGMCIAGRNLGIKSFVFYYEYPTIPYARNWWTSQYEYYKVKLVSDKLALWGDLTRPYMLNGHMCQESQILTTGAPRLDRWRNYDQNHVPKKQIVLMAYPGLEYFALCNFIDVIRTFAEKSKQYKDHKFLVKCKNSSQVYLTMDYLDGIKNHNLQISDSFDLVDLQANAKAVVGFNSLSILESMLSNAELINPNWGDADLADYLLQLDPKDPLVQKVYHLPKSQPEFSQLLDKIITTPEQDILSKAKENREDRRSLLSRFFYVDPKKSSCALFEKMMLDELNEA